MQDVYNPVFTIPASYGIPLTPATVENLRVQRQLTSCGSGVASRVYGQGGHYPTLSSVFDGLPFNAAQVGTWKSFLSTTFACSRHPAQFRASFHQKAREDGLDPVLTKALLQRAMHYARQRFVAKSQGVYTADDLLVKADGIDTDEDDETEAGWLPDDDDEDVPDDDGDGDEDDDGLDDHDYDDDDLDDDGDDDDDYGDDEDDDGTGTDDAQQAASDLTDVLASAGQGGAPVQAFGDLVQRYGPDLLATVLKAMLDEGQVRYDGQKFIAGGGGTVPVDDGQGQGDAPPPDDEDTGQRPTVDDAGTGISEFGKSRLVVAL